MIDPLEHKKKQNNKNIQQSKTYNSYLIKVQCVIYMVIPYWHSASPRTKATHH